MPVTYHQRVAACLEMVHFQWTLAIADVGRSHPYLKGLFACGQPSWGFSLAYRPSDCRSYYMSGNCSIARLTIVHTVDCYSWQPSVAARLRQRR